MAYSYLSHLECSVTGRRYDADVVQGLSDEGAPLLARYDLERVRAEVDRGTLAGRAVTMWRYHELLPVRDPTSVVTLGEGWTPLLPLPTHGARMGLPRLLVKDEGTLPTGSFKARGAAAGLSRARELGVAGVGMPTNGNAGAAWSMYAARAGLPALVGMPVDAPEICRRECVAAGAELYLVDGLIHEAGAIVREAVGRRPGWQDVSTLKEPYRLEGKKTMGFELAEQLGWRVPDAILYPAGGGVGLIGIHKALAELQELGWIGADLPRLVAVQATGCAPVVDAVERGLDRVVPVKGATTVAFGINVPAPLGDALMLQAIRATDGTAVAVSDEDIVAEVRAVTTAEGLFVCPEGAACFVAARRLREEGWLAADDEVVVLNTGTGLVYPDAVLYAVPTLPRDGRIVG
ncbi:MAG: threonine synthase [Lapillicoccus sp.]